MYIPAIYKNNDEDDIRRFIRAHPFGILVSAVSGSPWATHIPFVLENDDAGEFLSAHVSKANPQWREIAGDREALAIFSGPHAYISSSWYDHPNVPTWNYIAVHVYGKVSLTDDNGLRSHLRNLISQHERGEQKPLSFDTMPRGMIEQEIRGIAGLRMDITRIHAVKKLSQNRDEKNHDAIISQLEKRNDPDSAAIAESMKRDNKTQGS